jgi:hypothetical protein
MPPGSTWRLVAVSPRDGTNAVIKSEPFPARDMDSLRVAPSVGIVASLAVLAMLAAPYLLADSTASVGVYYDSGVVNPLLAGLFGLVAVIVFAAGREGRSDPGLAAGVALALGLFIVVVALAWALTVRVDVLEISQYHPWTVVATTVPAPVSAGWFARALGVL